MAANVTTFELNSQNIIIEVLANSSAATSVSLPENTLIGQIVTVKDGTGLAGINPITISDPLGNMIDGGTTCILNNNWQSFDMYWNGTAWRIK